MFIPTKSASCFLFHSILHQPLSFSFFPSSSHILLASSLLRTHPHPRWSAASITRHDLALRVRGEPHPMVGRGHSADKFQQSAFIMILRGFFNQLFFSASSARTVSKRFVFIQKNQKPPMECGPLLHMKVFHYDGWWDEAWISGQCCQPTLSRRVLSWFFSSHERALRHGKKGPFLQFTLSKNDNSCLSKILRGDDCDLCCHFRSTRLRKHSRSKADYTCWFLICFPHKIFRARKHIGCHLLKNLFINKDTVSVWHYRTLTRIREVQCTLLQWAHKSLHC